MFPNELSFSSGFIGDLRAISLKLWNKVVTTTTTPDSPRPGDVYQMTTLVDHPTATWEPLQDGQVFYSRKNVYSMQWTVGDLSNYIVAGARFGGPVGQFNLSFHKMIVEHAFQRY